MCFKDPNNIGRLLPAALLDQARVIIEHKKKDNYTKQSSSPDKAKAQALLFAMQNNAEIEGWLSDIGNGNFP